MMRASSTSVLASTVQHSWLYKAMLDACEKSMGIPEHVLPGPGQTKQQLIDLCLLYQSVNPSLKTYSAATMRAYLKAAVRYGLLEAAGNSTWRRYFPPGCLSEKRLKNIRKTWEKVRHLQ
jgi:hypothetical protein